MMGKNGQAVEKQNKTTWAGVEFEPVVGCNAWCAVDDFAEKAEYIASFVYYPDEPKEPMIEFLHEHGLVAVDAVVMAILAQGHLGHHVRVTYNKSSKAFTYFSMQTVDPNR